MCSRLLSEQEVVRIFELLAERKLTQAQIGAKFGVSRGTIKSINAGDNWRHLMPDGWFPTGGVGALSGEKSNLATLTETQAIEVRRLALEGAYTLRKQLARCLE